MKEVHKFYLFVLLLLLLFSCTIFYGTKSSNSIQTMNTSTTATPNPTSNTKETYTIGWSVYNNSNEFFQFMQEGVLAKAKELGMKVIIHDEKSSTAEMITGVTHLIEQGIDALVISPFNPEAMVTIVPLAKEKGIPVVVVDIGTGGTDVDAFIISDSFGGGILAGEYALKLIKTHSIPSKNIAIIKVEETSTYARRRGDGFKRVMEDSGYTTIAEVTANSDKDQAYEQMKKILETSKNDLAVVFSENDQMALGAAQAIEEAGLKGKIMVIGFDGIPAAVTAIKEGTMQGTIAQQPYEMGVLGAEYAYAFLTGGRIIYDDPEKKQLYTEVYLIDETGTAIKQLTKIP